MSTDSSTSTDCGPDEQTHTHREIAPPVAGTGPENNPQVIAPSISDAKPRWCLLRFDDNGNEFEMARFAEEAQARSACLEYERRGHKQTYFVRAVDEA
jgi:hypothetical protein